MSLAPKGWHIDLEKQQSAFYHEIGRCVSAWSFADEELFSIFHECVGPYEQCAIIYYRINSLDGRMSLTDAIVLSVIPKRERKNGGKDSKEVTQWKGIKKRFTGLLRDRSRIAHQQVHVAILASEVDAKGDPVLDAKFATAFELNANTHERMKTTGSTLLADDDTPPLAQRDLTEHFNKVMMVTFHLQKFKDDVLLKRSKGKGI